MYDFVKRFFERGFFMQAVSQDLTQGGLSGHLVRLAAPLVVGNILQEFYNTIDALVVGRFAGQEEFAAIGVAGTVMNLFLFALVGCCNGFSVLFARGCGQRDYTAVRRRHFAALLAGLGCTALLMLVGLCALGPLLQAMQTPAVLQGYTAVYLRWIFASLPAAFLYNLFAALLRAAGDTRAALLALAAAVSANLVLDLAFVAGLGLGIAGAAAATATTQVFSAVFCYFYLHRTHPELLLRRGELQFNASLTVSTLQFGLVTSLQQCSLYLGKMLVQGTVNGGGTDAIAAYTAGTRIEAFANSFETSAATSVSILVAQNAGAGRSGRVEQSFRCGTAWLLGMGTLSGVIMLAAGAPAIGLVLGASSGAAFTQAVHYLQLVALFYPFCFLGGSFVGYFSGRSAVQWPFAGTTLHITMRVILSWLLFAHMGLNAVALATGLGWAMACLFWSMVKTRYGRMPANV